MKRKGQIAGAATAAATFAALGFQFLNYQSSTWGLALIAGALGLGIYVAAEVCLWLVPRVRLSLIPLPEAAASLYEQARMRGSMWARVAERLSGPNISDGSPDDVLNWVATWIVGRAEIQGIRPPSKSRETIRERHGNFESGAQHYRTNGHFFTELAVKRSDLRRIAKEIRKGDEANELAQALAAATELSQLRERVSALRAARTRLRTTLGLAKSQMADVQNFIRIWHGSVSPMSGTIAMRPPALDDMTALLRDGIAAAQVTGFANGLEAPVFVAPPETHLRQGSDPSVTTFYRNDNWPYMNELTHFGDRSAAILQQLSSQSFLLEEDLNVTERQVEALHERLARKP